MSGYVDFLQIKKSIGIDQAVRMLGLDLKPHGQQLRGRCPIHRGANEREFVVTPAKGLFYCFGGCGGGDLITLVAKVKDINTKDAANLIAEQFGLETAASPGNGSAAPKSSRRGVPQSQPNSETSVHKLQPLAYLEARHELVQKLGLSAGTAEAFGAGYAPRGIMRGRLAIPIHDTEGNLLAYCGQALKGESPALTFPNGFDPESVIFNANRIDAGDLILARNPLKVLEAHEHGIVNVVAFLTTEVSGAQLEKLAALMTDKHCERIELF